MSGFSADWLDLREPADHAARDGGLLTALRTWAGARQGLLVMDLGSGTGSTCRALAEVLPDARWRLVDADGALLADAARRHPGIDLMQTDLAATPLPRPEGVGLVTASALFDLVSAEWAGRFCDRLIAARLPLYAALSYDGIMRWMPEHGLDGAVTAAFNRHQVGDKGFGPALGPHAAEFLADRLAAAGWRVELAGSPWRLAADELHFQLLRGIAAAVRETGDLPPEAVADWLHFRETHADDGWIGHTDLWALPD